MGLGLDVGEGLGLDVVGAGVGSGLVPADEADVVLSLQQQAATAIIRTEFKPAAIYWGIYLPCSIVLTILWNLSLPHISGRCVTCISRRGQ